MGTLAKSVLSVSSNHLELGLVKSLAAILTEPELYVFWVYSYGCTLFLFRRDANMLNTGYMEFFCDENIIHTKDMDFLK